MPQAAPTGGAQRADARANHTAMLEAATALAGYGDIALPYDEIALAAGVGRATVYRHFPTREALSRAIIEAALDRWDKVVAELAPGPTQFDELFTAWVRSQQDRSHSVEQLTRCASSKDRRWARRRIERTVRRPLRDAQQAGTVGAELSVRDVRIVLTMLSAALRANDSTTDCRRAVELARQLLFTGN